MNGIQDAQRLVDELFRLAKQFPDQPVAIIEKDGKLQVGVMSLYKPESDDWMYEPISVDQLMNTAPEPESKR